MDEIKRAADAIDKAKTIAVLTGAGVSAESGVPTFRASDGLWEGHRIEDVATPEGFRRDPALVWQFYNARRANVKLVEPNPGHFALAKLEERLGEQFTLITQNVDGLHQRAGCRNVLEVHGSLYRTRCTGCRKIVDRGLDALDPLPKCEDCGKMLRPDSVWFNENLPQDVWEKAALAAATCDVFLIVGTSAVVYPAAGLAQMAKERNRIGEYENATVIEFNLTQTAASDFADLGIYGPSGETLRRVIEQL